MRWWIRLFIVFVFVLVGSDEARVLEIFPDCKKPLPPPPDPNRCVFAISPLPPVNPDGSRGGTYTGHGSARDYPAWPKTPLYAMTSCKLIHAVHNAECGHGIALACNFKGDIMQLTYCHLRALATIQETYMPGDIIGYSGNSGRTSGPHLHLSLLHIDSLLPVPRNDVDAWFKKKGCYTDLNEKPNLL